MVLPADRVEGGRQMYSQKEILQEREAYQASESASTILFCTKNILPYGVFLTEFCLKRHHIFSGKIDVGFHPYPRLLLERLSPYTNTRLAVTQSSG